MGSARRRYAAPRRRARRRACVGGSAAMPAGPTSSSPRRSSACSSSFLGPVVVSLVMSFLEINMVTIESRWVGWRNYEALLVSREFGLATFNTLYFTFASVPLGVGVALVSRSRSRRASGSRPPTAPSTSCRR